MMDNLKKRKFIHNITNYEKYFLEFSMAEKKWVFWEICWELQLENVLSQLKFNLFWLYKIPNKWFGIKGENVSREL